MATQFKTTAIIDSERPGHRERVIEGMQREVVKKVLSEGIASEPLVIQFVTKERPHTDPFTRAGMLELQGHLTISRVRTHDPVVMRAPSIDYDLPRSLNVKPAPVRTWGQWGQMLLNVIAPEVKYEA